MTLTEYLDAIEARVEAATKEPWRVQSEWSQIGLGHITDVRHKGWSMLTLNGQDDQAEHDAQMVAHARTDLPRLVQMLRLAISALEKIADKTQFQSDMVAKWSHEALADLDAIGGDKGTREGNDGDD